MSQPPVKEDVMPTESPESSDDGGSAPANVIDDFTHLYARQTGYNTFNVLNLGGEVPSAHEVNLAQWTCKPRDGKHSTCKDGTCKHLAYACYQAPERHRADEEAAFRVSRYSYEMLQAAQSIERLYTGLEADQVADAADSPAQSDTEASVPEPDDPVGCVEVWLEENVAASTVPDLRVGEHDGEAGVCIEPNKQQMSEGQYKGFKAAIGELSGVTWHLGFLDDGCDVCGVNDGEFWIFVPYTVSEVYES